jgi:hypothetical protein
MSDTVTLLLPVGAPYQALGSELARKYIEIAGGSPAEADAGAESVAAALSRAAGGAAAATEMTVTFALEAGRVDVSVRCGDRSAEARQLVPART